MNLFLANCDYQSHSTNEGNQLQIGLEFAGWTLAGQGYGDNCRDVQALLARHKPETVFVHDKRDWSPDSPGCYRKDVGFQNLSALQNRPDIFRVCVVKDAGSLLDYHSRFCREIGADSVLIYYHERSVRAVAPFLNDYPLIRTWHTVDSEFLDREVPINDNPRRMAVVSGALSKTYPLRQRIVEHHKQIGCDHIKHPGYGNRGCYTPAYLREIAKYKVHLATASNYKFALRKLIESVAVGATPITDLSDYDVLPGGIDAALVRIPQSSSVADVTAATQKAARAWDLERAQHFSKLAREFYDWRAMGIRNDKAIAEIRAARIAHV